MKFTMSWLKEHLETQASVDEIADTLTDVGLEVEEVIDPAARLSAFTIGKVIAAEKHPDADRLRVCKVATDEGELQIICGAPNARQGITVVVAKPGTYVPGIDTTIQVGKIRGIESHGMMCSEREMELSEEHDGIIELPSGEVGERFVDWLAANRPDVIDPVIDIAITPNRGDALGVHGIARDLAARGLGTLIPREVPEIEGTFDSTIQVTIDEDTREEAPHFCGRLIKGVKNGPSPEWLQKRLKAIGLRPISFLVDVTNFFTYDMNRPLHVFDADKVKGDLRVHKAQGGEEMLALDEKTYTLEPGMIAISDDNGVESLAGIMGGEHSGCTDDTVNVFVESAFWEPVRIATTGRALKIHSDARYRFERGIDPAFTRDGLELAVKMIMDHAGGEASHLVEAGEAPDVARAYPLDTARVESLVGMRIPEREQRQILTSLGFRLEASQAHVPSWRSDVQGQADLVEEVARIASLTKLEGKPLPRSAGVAKPVLTRAQAMVSKGRRTMAALGYNECVTYTFIDEAAAAAFGGGTDDTRVANPISSEMSHMRPQLLPGLLRAAERNQARGQMNLALFEAGDVFEGGEAGEQHMQIAGLLVGQSGPKDIYGSARPVDVFDVKADIEAVLAALGAPQRLQILRDGPEWFHPGRHGRIGLGPKVTIGVFGELHPKVIAGFDIKGPVMGFLIRPDAIPAPRKSSIARSALEISEFQAVERDFAFVVDARTEAATLVNAALGADKAIITNVRVFDEFEGGSLGEGKKSLAIAVRMEPKSGTMTEQEIDAVAQKVIAKVTKATGGTIRS